MTDGINIVEVARALGVRIVGSEKSTRCACPVIHHEHDDKDPKCYLGGNNNEVWHCKKCNSGGEAIKFITHYLQCAKGEAVQWLREKGFLKNGNGTGMGVSWPDFGLIKKREWTTKALEELGCKNRKGIAGWEICFPMRDANGTITGWSRRLANGEKYKGDKKNLYQKNSKQGLFMSWPLPDGPVLLVEGETDAMAAASCGFAVIGTPGAVLSKQCRKYLQEIMKARETILCPDADAAGDNWKQTVIHCLAHHAKSIKILPDIDEDLDVTLRKIPKENRKAYLKTQIQKSKIETNPAEIEDAIICNHELDRMYQEAVQALLDSEDTQIYQMSGMLYRMSRQGEEATLHRVDGPWLRREMARIGNFIKFKGDRFIPVAPPKDLIEIILSSKGEWEFPKIVGISKGPTIDIEGNIVSQMGYDKRTGILCMGDVNITTRDLTQEEAEQEIKGLLQVMDEFPFKNSISESVAISAIFSAVVRPAISKSPMHVFTAPVMGSGKSLLADVAAYVATGNPAPVMEHPRDQDEFGKRLAAALLAGEPIINIDNITFVLRSNLLSQCITQDVLKIRPLGVSELVNISSRAQIFSTGNNIKIDGDMARRSLCCSIEPKVERPELREFKRDLHKYIPDHRAEILGSVISIIKSYLDSKDSVDATPLAGFHEWNKMVREPLMWAGLADPCESMVVFRVDDPELDLLSRLIGFWKDSFGALPLTIREATTKVEIEKNMYEAYAGLLEVFQEVSRNEKINNNKIGCWFKRVEGRVVDGMSLQRHSIYQRSIKWYIRIEKNSEEDY